MQHRFISIDEFIASFEVELLDIYYEYGLLEKFDRTAKKVFLWIFIQKLNDLLHDKTVILYFNGRISENHELNKHFMHDKLNKFIEQICFRVKKHINRLIFVSPNTVIDSTKELDGEIIDELILLNNEKFPDLKKLKDFLQKHNLTEMFASLKTKI